MRTKNDITSLLDELNKITADELEDQDLEFKQWKINSLHDAVQDVIDYAICMANGGGGTVVFGVADKVIGRENAILGVPPEIDINRLKIAVYDNTDPKITPVLEDLRVVEGTGRVLLMHIYPGLPPYTDTAGRGKVRIGKDCKPLTGSLRRKIAVETGETDLTSERVEGPIHTLISQIAMERLRSISSQTGGPAELIRLNDIDLLTHIGVIRDSKLTKGGLLLAGRDQSIREYFPGYNWTYLRMITGTSYSNRVDGPSAMAVALARLEELINNNNSITTLKLGFFHFEYRTYPLVAFREALMNAFCHADYRLSSSIMVKQFDSHLEISNPGGFIGGITAANILHHPQVARNPNLVDALLKMRLVNRSSLGISRMFEAMLMEGKEPPIIEELGNSIIVAFKAQDFSSIFRQFVEEEARDGYILSVDELLILQFLLKHTEIDTTSAANLCQRDTRSMFDTLTTMEQRQYIERCGSGRGTYWIRHPITYRRMSGDKLSAHDKRIEWDAAKTRVLSVLIERAQRCELGLSNAEIRSMTHLERYKVTRLMKELIKENKNIKKPGRGRYARYSIDLANES